MVMCMGRSALRLQRSSAANIRQARRGTGVDRATRSIALALTLAALAAPVRAANEPAIGKAALPAARIGAALETVSKTVRPGRIGYATVTDGNKYIQCRRLPDRSMRCEAAGATMQPALGAVLTPDRLARLAALGWSLDDSFGNYVRVFPATMPTADIAVHIVRAFAAAYGTDPIDLERATTWIEDVPCPPRNGPGQPLAGIVNDDPTMVRIRSCAYAAGATAAEPAASARALVARAGASVSAEIHRLRVNAQRHVISIFDTGQGYVQCAPESAETLYCEAQSPQSWPALASVITPERLARLHAAGYADPGRAANYWKRYRLAADSDAAIATEILTLLYEVYGYSGATPLDIKTE
jgi:hypothetical protein